ncbi:MAG: DNA-binding protein [Nitrococcus sp.]|nr:DNA-binding protein [Nitrococcus sp.]
MHNDIIVIIRSAEENPRSRANLIVRNLDDQIVQALKERAVRHKRSAEAEHRAILKQVLLKPRHKIFAQVLAAMPYVGRDEDFERVDDKNEAPRVLD